MPVIVCYGDSNTWGYDPVANERFGPNTRWTGVLRNTLGPSYTVIEEGLNGRTTNIDDIIEDNRNGRTYLTPCLQSHAPFDLITIMLGTNDLKERFHRSASDIAQSAVALGTIAARSGAGIDGGSPKVLILAPPPITTDTDLGGLLVGGDVKSREFSERYRTFADRAGFDFLDTGSIIVSSAIDGIHFEADQHTLLGQAVAKRITQMLST